jgi:hypothetical protein
VKADGKKLEIRTRLDECVIDAGRKYEQPTAFNPETPISDHKARSAPPHQVELRLRVEVQRAPVLGLIPPRLGTAAGWKGERL